MEGQKMSKILNSIGLAVLMAALLVGTGAAAEDVVVTGDVTSITTITAPEAFTMTMGAIGANYRDDKTATVTTNDNILL